MNFKKVYGYLTVILAACILFGCKNTSHKDGENNLTENDKNDVSTQTSYFPYEDLKELYIDKNTDSEKIKEIVSKLPVPADYLELRNAKIESTKEGDGLILEYDELFEKAKKLELPDNPLYHSPYFDTGIFNNSLLLMLGNDNISYVKVDISIPKEYAEESGRAMINEISREDLIKKDINLEYMEKNSSYYHEVLEFNNAINADRLFYNRVRLGSDEEFLIYRNGEPDRKEESENSEKIYTYGDENSYTSFKLNAENNGSGEVVVTAISVHPGKGDFDGGEMLYNLGLLPKDNEFLKKDRVESYLGEPKMKFDNRVYYRISSDISDYLYFIYSDTGEVVEYGVWKWIIPAR